MTSPSDPAQLIGHRMAIPPGLVSLGQLPPFPLRLSLAPPRRIRLTRHRIDLRPRTHRPILSQHRKLNRRIRALTGHPTQRPPHPMRPPRRPVHDPKRRHTPPLTFLLRRRGTPRSHTQRQPRFPPHRSHRYRLFTLSHRSSRIKTNQPAHRRALPPRLPTPRDPLQLKRHTPISGELHHRWHHPPRSHLRPRLARHTPSMTTTPDNLLQPTRAAASGGRGQPRTPAPLRRATKITHRDTRSSGLVVSSRRSTAEHTGRGNLTRPRRYAVGSAEPGQAPIRRPNRRALPKGCAARRQPATPLDL